MWAVRGITSKGKNRQTHQKILKRVKKWRWRSNWKKILYLACELPLYLNYRRAKLFIWKWVSFTWKWKRELVQIFVWFDSHENYDLTTFRLCSLSERESFLCLLLNAFSFGVYILNNSKPFFCQHCYDSEHPLNWRNLKLIVSLHP